MSTVHTIDGVVLIEFESTAHISADGHDYFTLSKQSVHHLQSASSLHSLGDAATAEIRALTGLDRVIAYRRATGRFDATYGVAGLTMLAAAGRFGSSLRSHFIRAPAVEAGVMWSSTTPVASTANMTKAERCLPSSALARTTFSSAPAIGKKAEPPQWLAAREPPTAMTCCWERSPSPPR